LEGTLQKLEGFLEGFNPCFRDFWRVMIVFGLEFVTALFFYFFGDCFKKEKKFEIIKSI